MSKHKALELAEHPGTSYVAADTIRAQHAQLEQQRQLIVQMREALGNNVNGCSLAIDAPKMARAALAAADQYLKDNP